MFFISKKAFEKAVEKKMWEANRENALEENCYRIAKEIDVLSERVGRLEQVILRAKRKAVPK